MWSFNKNKEFVCKFVVLFHVCELFKVLACLFAPVLAHFGLIWQNNAGISVRKFKDMCKCRGVFSCFLQKHTCECIFLILVLLSGKGVNF